MASNSDDGTTGLAHPAPDPRSLIQGRGVLGGSVPDGFPGADADGWARATSPPPSEPDRPVSVLSPGRTEPDPPPAEGSPPLPLPGPPSSDTAVRPPDLAGAPHPTAPDGSPPGEGGPPAEENTVGADGSPAPDADSWAIEETTEAIGTTEAGAAEVGAGGEAGDAPDAPAPAEPPFILYKSGEAFGSATADLATWVHGLLLPVYGREVSSTAAWCTRWWEHLEAVAQLYGLWMAWMALTNGDAPLTGPASWHRDFLNPVMLTLRDPSGTFAGCKPGRHRKTEPVPIEEP
ncbi:DUF4913 domain-containing protein [Streptomyces sp. NPDC006872]|uniref:DUF4913 domain-containing protein n=1 Tax=Streptomyces sp. NPDC006872 TaxID=3155720 RepID=UPI0033F5B58A